MIQINLLSSVGYNPKEPVEQCEKYPKRTCSAVWKMMQISLLSCVKNDQKAPAEQCGIDKKDL